VPLDLRDGADDQPRFAAAHNRQERDRRLKLLSIFNLGSTLSRKNPAGAIKVFQKLRHSLGASVSLTLKVGGVENYPERYLDFLALDVREPGLDVVVSRFSDAKLNQLIDEHDIYLSMHRAEGLGLLLAKAMSRRKAVAATRWSGNLDFMTDQSSLLVDYRPTTILDENKNAPNELACAEPDPADAAAKILQLAGNPGGLLELGRNASAQIESVSEFALSFNRGHLFDG
jgi:glycosyltransferase involved in cell wall biosynthesis